MRRMLTAILTISICLGISNPARGQTEVQINEPQVTYTFGETLTIKTQITSEIPTKNIIIYLQADGSNPQIVEQLINDPINGVSFVLDLTNNPLLVFSNVTYWYQIELENGQTITSKEFSFYYEDNRFAWQSLQTEEFVIYWYHGDTEFGQSILNTAYEGLERLRGQVNIPTPHKIAYYVYASADEMQSALQLSGQNTGWIAGHASPQSGLILVSISPGPAQSLEIKRQIPHELTHVMLYQKLGDDYENLPNWLSEGLASTTELFPNPDYPLLLERASEHDRLINISDLCLSFPTDATNFQLAYAESAAFTWYLQGVYGDTSMEKLIAAYADGMDCNRGVEVAFEKTLSELERDWRRVTFNENPIRSSLVGLFPWFMVFLILMMPSVGLFVVDTISHRRSNQ
jgi:hypothetical protein